MRRSALPGEPGARRIHHDDVRRAGLLAELLDRLAHVAREERCILDAVQLGVLDRARDGFLGDLEPPDRLCVAGERQSDRAGAAVEVVDVLVTGEPRVLPRELVQRRCHLRIRLQERRRADAETQAEDLLLDRLDTPEELRRKVRLLGGCVVDRPVHRSHLGKPPKHVDEIPGFEALAGRGDEHDERLSGVPALANHEMAEVPRS